MTLQELLNELHNRVDADYANRVHDAAWKDGAWNWDEALKVYDECKGILAKIDEIKRLAEQYSGTAQ